MTVGVLSSNLRLAIVSALLVMGFGAKAEILKSETLFDAFTAAYAANPVLGSQRGAVKVAEQEKAISQTGYAPLIQASGDYAYQDTRGRDPGGPTQESTVHPRGAGVNLQQNIFNGFRTTNSVAREDASLRAERDRLRDVEQKVLLDVARAYADVLRDKTVVVFHRGDNEVLAARARETRLRFEIGDLTRTDVDQSEAALARARADLTIAETNLESSLAQFRRVVGRPAGKLEPAAVPERLIPSNVGQAIAVAQNEHPAILAALDGVAAAESNIEVEKAGYSPSLDLTASAQRRWDPDFYPARTIDNAYQVKGTLTIPIFDRGLTSASVRRATELAGQRLYDLDTQRDQIRADVVQNFGLFAASRSVIASADQQIAANDRALFGVQLEATAGQRTTLDILTAQRSLLNARVDRAVAVHDRIVAGYSLLSSIGRLSLSRIVAADTRGRDADPPPTQRSRPAVSYEPTGSIGKSPLRPSL